MYVVALTTLVKLLNSLFSQIFDIVIYIHHTLEIYLATKPSVLSVTSVPSVPFVPNLPVFPLFPLFSLLLVFSVFPLLPVFPLFHVPVFMFSY